MEAERKKSGQIVEAESKSLSSRQNVMGVQSLLCFLILAAAWLVGFSSRLFAVVRFESIIHEFDPW